MRKFVFLPLILAACFEVGPEPGGDDAPGDAVALDAAPTPDAAPDGAAPSDAALTAWAIECDVECGNDWSKFSGQVCASYGTDPSETTLAAGQELCEAENPAPCLCYCTAKLYGGPCD